MKGTVGLKTVDRYALLYAKMLRVMPRFRADESKRVPARREETIAALAQALERRGRRIGIQKRLTQFGAVAAAATVLLGCSWIWSRYQRGIDGPKVGDARVDRVLKVLGPATAGREEENARMVTVGAEGRSVTNGMTLEPGTGLVAPETSEVRIGTMDGTVLTLERSSELTVVEQSTVQRFSLNAGAVRVHVAKLKSEERFIVTTVDAEVEVHGTVFRVAVLPDDRHCERGVRTRVSVFEGVVSVRTRTGETFVPAGGKWPEGCSDTGSGSTRDAIGDGSPLVGAAAASAPAVVVEPPSGDGARRAVSTRIRHKKPSSGGTASGSASVIAAAGPARGAPTTASVAQQTAKGQPGPAPMGSLLAAQNDLFLGAIRAKRQENNAEAARLFSTLIDKYPDGPLVEGAMAQRMRILHQSDARAARQAAAQYLARFPNGFDRAEARQLVGSEP